MIKKGDLKFRLHGKRLKGDFALIHMKARRPGSKGTEWLLIKKHDDHVAEDFNIDEYETSVLSGKTMAQIAGDEDSAEWESSKKAARGKLKAPWLAESLAKLDKKKTKTITTEDTEKHRGKKKDNAVSASKSAGARSAAQRNTKNKNSSVTSVSSAVRNLQAAAKRPMPTVIHPMLATIVEHPFDDPEWLFEIKWDGYRAVAFIENGKIRLDSRN